MINIMIGYDDHTSTYAVPTELASNLLEMDNTDAINDYIVDRGYYTQDSYEAQQSNVFLDLYAEDLSLFHSEIREELATTC